MKLEKISSSIYFWNKEKDQTRRYGYIFKRKGRYILKTINKSSDGVKSIYLEDTKNYKTLKECKDYINKIL